MNITVKTGGFAQEQSDVIAIGVLENPDFYSAPLQNIEQALGGRIREVMNLGDFTGKHKTTSWLYTNGAIAAPRVLLVGLGEYHDLTAEKVREAAGNAARAIRDMGLSTAAIPIPIEATPEMIQAATEGSLLALYQFNEHKTNTDDDDKKKKLESLTFLVENEQIKATIEGAVARGQTIANGTRLARDLSNQPANYLTPTQLAEKAQTVAEATGLDCEIFDKATLEEKGFRTLLAVAQGSVEEPRFIILEYTPDGEGETRYRCACRKRDYLRHRWNLPQIRRRYARDEARYVGCCCSDRRDAGDRTAEAQRARHWCDCCVREYAEWDRC